MADIALSTSTAVIPGTNANIQSGTAGATVAVGNPIYRDAATSNSIKPADASLFASSVVAGFAITAANTGQKVFYVSRDASLTHGLDASQITPGATLYLSANAGRITITPGDLSNGEYLVILGQINNPETTMNFDPSTAVLKA